mmetsp:Transcript_48174/g.75240  ORF Transcript_48174/g.75240 Transcript_48174/m.75240 type:complete len:129 (-) Transcript_48174:287-673(-)
MASQPGAEWLKEYASFVSETVMTSEPGARDQVWISEHKELLKEASKSLAASGVQPPGTSVPQPAGSSTSDSAQSVPKKPSELVEACAQYLHVKLKGLLWCTWKLETEMWKVLQAQRAKAASTGKDPKP